MVSEYQQKEPIATKYNVIVKSLQGFSKHGVNDYEGFILSLGGGVAYVNIYEASTKIQIGNWTKKGGFNIVGGQILSEQIKQQKFDEGFGLPKKLIDAITTQINSDRDTQSIIKIVHHLLHFYIKE